MKPHLLEKQAGRREMLSNDARVSSRECLSIMIKIGWPLILAVVFAAVLIFMLGTNKQVGGVPLDAFTWPAFMGTSTNGTSQGGAIGNQSNLEIQQIHRKPLDGEVIHCVLAITTCLLIFLNTWMYLVENDDNPTVGKNRRLKYARRIVDLCQLATGLWFLKMFFGWPWGSFADEIIPLVIFFVFFWVDLLNYQIFREKAIAHPDDKSLKIERSFAGNQAAFVDLPVVMGILVSIILAVHLNWKFSSSEHYLSGFFSGSTVMHLAASQIIFALLAFKRGYSLAKISS